MIKVYPEKTLFLRQHLGEGTKDGEEFEISMNMGNGSLLVSYKGRYAGIDMNKFVKAALKKIDKALEKDNNEI